MPTCRSCAFESETAFRFCPECGAERPPATVEREQRRTVTIVFCDLAGSTALGEALDPERLRTLLARYFDRMRAIVERHGGTVEKFIGDAVMAVFGVPAAHEDDALRAVRAAAEMRDALPELGLEGRIGVMTGEVVTGTEERLATGDAVNVAARLEQAARPGEVLIGQPTFELVRDATEVEPVEPLLLKGKAAPVPAYRLVAVRDSPERRHDAPLVGRRRELAVLGEAWARTRDGRSCELVTVIGEAGVGKSRLTAEFADSIDAIVTRGRCLPYGDGITYWPVVEVLKQLGTVAPDEAATAAIRSLLRESEAPTSPDEIAWAFRKTLEHAARERPLLVVFDDVQWAEDAFRELIEHVALLSTGAPILLLCIARPELVERHPTWPVTLRLEPLDADDVDELIPTSIDDRVRARIAAAAGGNPLFVHEIVAMAHDADGDVVVPPTLQALLAARLDQLESSERGLLERGSIEGETFHRGAVQTLAPDDAKVTPRLASLVRKELIRPAQPHVMGEDGFRFRHILIRDAAYEGLPKAVRAELHARFAEWLEQHGNGLVELDEILGYHLQQANAYRAELGLPIDEELAASARERLTAAGAHATARQDFGAAVRLLERALQLAPEAEIDVATELSLINALGLVGRGSDAIERAKGVAARAAAAGDRVTELVLTLQATIVETSVDPAGSGSRIDALVAEALPLFEAAGDDVALRTAYHASARAAFVRGRFDVALQFYERAAVHARRARLTYESPGWLALCRVHGTTPAGEILSWLDARDASERDFFHRTARARTLALLGRFDDARALLAEMRSELADQRRSVVLAVVTGIASTYVELLDGDAGAAGAFGEEGCRLLEDAGDEGFLSTAAGLYALALYELGRLDDADAWALRASRLGARDDAMTQALWRRVRARILAHRGDHRQAETIAREALAIIDDTESIAEQADTRADLAEVLVLAGRRDEAIVAVREALERYERKGIVVSVGRARARLAELSTRV